MRLESVTLSGFRCFGHDPITVHISPEITAVVGPNAEGKPRFSFRVFTLLLRPGAFIP